MQTYTQQPGKNESLKQKSAITAGQKEYIALLENLLVFISQNVRKPTAQIQDLSYLDGTAADSPAQLNKKLLQVKQSALLLDNRTRELSVLIFKKVIKLKEQENG
ncbi:MAG: hypothetical protein H7141_04725 [Burkholderiales bacterium]|nr:hypothetical protein [Bacteroidia bacterium]